MPPLPRRTARQCRGCAGGHRGANGPASLVMADGQLVSWNLRVFLLQPQSLPPDARPVLCLLSGRAVADPAEGQKRP